MNQPDSKSSEQLFFNLYAHDPVYCFETDSHAIKLIIKFLTTARQEGRDEERKKSEGLYIASKEMLERLDFNGGIGEYKGGPVFVMKYLRHALDEWEGKK